MRQKAKTSLRRTLLLKKQNSGSFKALISSRQFMEGIKCSVTATRRSKGSDIFLTVKDPSSLRKNLPSPSCTVAARH